MRESTAEGVRMNLRSALLERAAIAMLVGGRRLMDAHGKLETQRMRSLSDYTRGDDIFPARLDEQQPIFDHADYNAMRVALLEEFISESRLDALVIVGCSFGRELVTLSQRQQKRIAIIGADMSERCIQSCRAY